MYGDQKILIFLIFGKTEFYPFNPMNVTLQKVCFNYKTKCP